MRVSPSAARSTAVSAPISTSSSTTTMPTCGILWYRPSRSRAKPKPSPPITAPFCTTTRLPSRQRSRTCTPEWITQSSPTHDALVEDDVRVERRARAHAHARPDHRERAHVHVRAEDRRGVHLRGRVHPGRGACGRPDERHRAGEGEVGVVGDEAGQGRRLARREDDGARPRGREVRGVARVGQEGDVAGARLLDGGHAPRSRPRRRRAARSRAARPARAASRARLVSPSP